MEDIINILEDGTRLRERYIIESFIGQGGFGITYKGRDLLFDTEVAIKEYFPSQLVSRNTRQSKEVFPVTINAEDTYKTGKKKFLDEAKTLIKFATTPGIVEVKDFFEENNSAYIVMEFLDGITLKKYLSQSGPMAIDDILTLMIPVLDALEDVHKAGLIHRDISPDNIMLLGDNGVKLMDFGAARDFTSYGEKSLSVILKPNFAPVEQYQSRGNQGPWTDIYSLSAVIYMSVTGCAPENALERLAEDTLKSPKELGARISDTVNDVLMKGLALFPKDRYPSLTEFRRDLYSESEEYGEIGKDTTLLLEHVSKPAAASEEEKTGTLTTFADNHSEEKDSPRKISGRRKAVIGLSGLCLACVFLVFAVVVILNSGKDKRETEGTGDGIASSLEVASDMNMSSLIAEDEISDASIVSSVDNGSDVNTSSVQEEKTKNEWEIGETVQMGSYMYRGEGEDDGAVCKLTWKVLDMTSDECLLICENIIGDHAMTNKEQYDGWEDSTLRKWLNNQFLNGDQSAFSLDEVEMIVEKTVSDKDMTQTKDKIFVPSQEEVEKYFPQESDRICKDLGNNTGHWLLRTKGEDGCVLQVSSSGNIHDKKPYKDDIGVRPMMWVKIP